jgi:lipase chaperone LimK
MKKNIIVCIIACIAVIITVWMSNQFIHVNTAPKPIKQSSTQIDNYEIDVPNMSTHIAPQKKAQSTKSTSETSSTDLNNIFGYHSKFGPLPKCLQGTDIDGELLVDANGKLVINNGLRNLFEYFLSALPEESLDTILGRIKEYVQYQIPEEPAQRAIAILESYISYKQKLEEVESPEGLQGEQLGTLDAIKDALANRMLLRRQFMSPEVVQAFFENEEKYDQFNLQLIDIKQNSVLSPEAKEEQIIELEQMLPESVRLMRQEERKREQIKKQIEDMRKQGKTEKDIYEFRKNEYGKEYADRWQKLEETRNKWDKKINEYMEQRKTISSDPNLTDQEKNLAIDRLKFESFDESEIRRVNHEEQLRLNNN